MKKADLAFALALLISALRPVTASAKAPTVKITIASGGLTSAIQVTDPQVLAFSDVWSGQFLDGARSPENEGPKALLPYEVSFYVKLAENDVRKMYVAYYYPNSSTRQGFIYLPGEGAVWELNVGTILREGRDGKWNYASPAWEALVKPLLSGAEALRRSVSASEAAMQKRHGLSKVSHVSVDGGWTKPQAGWLYVLDPRSESDHPGSRIWLLDPETATVMGSVRAGYDPDFALSRDGSRLYVASGERESGELAVIDTTSGTVAHIPFPDRILYKPWYEGLPPFSRMEVSSDGRALRILVQHSLSPEKIGYQLWTFDTQRGRFVDARVDLGNCGNGEFVPSSTAKQFDFLCPTTNRLHLIQLDAGYHETSNTFVKLPWPGRCGAVQGFLSPDSSTLAIVRGDGAIYQMDTIERKFRPTPVTSDCRDRLVFALEWPRSPDGAKVYLGYGPFAPDGLATAVELRIFDATTWQQLGHIQTSVPFWSAVASKEGRLIYALVPEQHCVLIIDTTTLNETRAISVGRTPALSLVAP
jgi:hypothetical protein